MKVVVGVTSFNRIVNIASVRGFIVQAKGSSHVYSEGIYHKTFPAVISRVA